MNKTFYSILILTIQTILLLTILPPQKASAVSLLKVCNSQTASSTVCKDPPTSNPVIKGLKIVLNVLSIATGIIAVFEILVAGFRFITANGDTNTYNQARDALLYAIIGIFIVAFSQVIVLLVLDKFS